MPVRSRYLHLIPDGDSLIAFSALSGGMVKLPHEIGRIFSVGPSQGLCEITKEHSELVFIGAIVSEGVDELDLMRVRIGQARYGDRTPNITIAPTLACNFRCVYCDQPNETRTQTITDEIARAVVEYIDKRLDGIEEFSVTWYGGEPLLVLDRLVSMQDAILSLCAKREIGLFTNVVTNGWLLDNSTVRRLIDAGIRQIQVTLDGPPEFHNLRRLTNDGNETFDRIMKNILAVRDHIDVRLRVNIDRNNASSLPEFLDLLEDCGLIENFYPAPVVCYEAPQIGIETPFLNGREMGEVLFPCLDRLSPNDASVLLTPIPLPCTALREATYVFGPNGYVYRCWHELGHPELAIDHVKEGGGNPARRLFWLNYDPLADPDCLECGVLPICLGGCPEQRRRGIKPPLCCSPISSHLHEFVRNYTKSLSK